MGSRWKSSCCRLRFSVPLLYFPLCTTLLPSLTTLNDLFSTLNHSDLSGTGFSRRKRLKRAFSSSASRRYRSNSYSVLIFQSSPVQPASHALHYFRAYMLTRRSSSTRTFSGRVEGEVAREGAVEGRSRRGERRRSSRNRHS